MQVHVIRHTPVASEPGRCYGQSDIALADTFVNDVDNYRSKLMQRYDAVFSSPLSRCTKLVDALGYSGPVLDASLMEINFGDWENTLWDDIDPLLLQAWMSDFVNVSPPGGENLLMLNQRVSQFMDALRSSGQQNILIVTHAGVIRCILAYLLAIPLDNIFKIKAEYGDVLSFDLGKQARADQGIRNY